jgi:hypothetical protein
MTTSDYRKHFPAPNAIEHPELVPSHCGRSERI